VPFWCCAAWVIAGDGMSVSMGATNIRTTTFIEAASQAWSDWQLQCCRPIRNAHGHRHAVRSVCIRLQPATTDDASRRLEQSGVPGSI
jgi:hypothetical protein